LGAAGKAGRVIDPMTYIAKGAGAGLSKIGDISAALKGVGNIEIPRLPDNAITLPEGAVRLPEGAVRLPEGAAIPPGGVRIPEGGAVTLPEGTALPAGAVDLGNGAVKLPEGTAVPPGAVELPEGTVKLPDDAPVLPEGTVKLPTEDGAPARYYDPEGNILDEGGNVIAKADDGPGDVVDQPGIPRDGADLPRVDSPVREPAMAGAATHVDNAGQHVRLGSDIGDLGDLGRIGDDATPAVHTGDNLPGSTADNLPGGRADNLPTNSVGPHPSTGPAANQVPGNGAGDGLPGGATDDVGASGTHVDGPAPGSGHHIPPALGDGLPGGFDDGARAGDDAATNSPPRPGDPQYGAGSTEWVPRTPEQMKWWHDEHVRLANEDPTWFNDHYDRRGHRRTAEEIVDGQYLPKLTEGTNPRWLATDDLPSAPGEQYRLPPKPVGLDSVPAHVGPKLDELADAHQKYLDLGDAQRTYEKSPTPENLEALEAAREAMGDRANNTKIGEALGEGAAKHHVIPHEFADAQWVDLMETGNGARRFDQLYRLDNGTGDFLIVEAKAPGGELDWRKGAGEEHGRKRVKQGTIEYVQTILEEMKARGGADKAIAEEMARALRREKVQYVMVQANKHTGSYAGAELNYFDLYREGR
ncbi:hypothetical protein AB0O67_17815, partial [Streptomyces sp. NPDC086077]